MIKAILWDIDGTLLDFSKSEKWGIKACLEEIGFFQHDDDMLTRYEDINRRYWEALERGEVTKQEVLLGRFRTFFAKEKIVCEDIESFNASFQRKLGEVFFENERSVELCNQLKTRVKQYVVTNGTVIAQRNKLRGSGLDQCMEGIFISDEIGVEKPGIGFFEPVFQAMDGIQKSEILIIGDSLTSDMRGGNVAGIRCCWYNPKGIENTTDVRLDYEIQSLWEVEKLLEYL